MPVTSIALLMSAVPVYLERPTALHGAVQMLAEGELGPPLFTDLGWHVLYRHTYEDGRALDDEPDADRGEIRARRFDEHVFEAADAEPFDKNFLGRQVDELRQPVERQPHQSCSSTRRSPSNRWRICGSP